MPKRICNNVLESKDLIKRPLEEIKLEAEELINSINEKRAKDAILLQEYKERIDKLISGMISMLEENMVIMYQERGGQVSNEKLAELEFRLENSAKAKNKISRFNKALEKTFLEIIGRIPEKQETAIGTIAHQKCLDSGDYRMVEDIRADTQNVIESINEKRKRDGIFLQNLEKQMKERVFAVRHELEQRFVLLYEESGRRIEEKACELFSRLEKADKLQRYVTRFDEALGSAYMDLQGNAAE